MSENLSLIVEDNSDLNLGLPNQDTVHGLPDKCIAAKLIPSQSTIPSLPMILDLGESNSRNNEIRSHTSFHDEWI